MTAPPARWWCAAESRSRTARSCRCWTRPRPTVPPASRWWGADMRHRATPPSLITRVNVTPIIDVALVLVIILLVTAPMLSSVELPVNLPQARTREAESERNVSVTLSADGRLAVDGDLVTAESLRSRLSTRLADPGNANVLVVI